MYKKYKKRTRAEFIADKQAEQEIIFEEIGDAVLGALKEEKNIWEMPWMKNPENTCPHNVESEHFYKGDNFWICLFKQYAFKKRQDMGEDIPNPTGNWYTAAYLKHLNDENLKKAVDGEKVPFIHIRKGEKGTTLVRFQPVVESEEERLKREAEGKPKPAPKYIYFTAYNSCQIVGLPEVKVKTYDHTGEMSKEKEAELDGFFAELAKNTGVNIKYTEEFLDYTHDADRAYYHRLDDEITIPKKERFRTLAEYYGTLFHEYAHSTGHKSRLNRFKDSFKTEHERYDARAKEEITAEFSACYLSKYFGTSIDLSYKNNISYMATWRKNWTDNLEGKRSWLRDIMRDSSNAVNFLLSKGLVKKKEVEKEIKDLTPDEKQQNKTIVKSL